MATCKIERDLQYIAIFFKEEIKAYYDAHYFDAMFPDPAYIKYQLGQIDCQHFINRIDEMIVQEYRNNFIEKGRLLNCTIDVIDSSNWKFIQTKVNGIETARAIRGIHATLSAKKIQAECAKFFAQQAVDSFFNKECV